MKPKEILEIEKQYNITLQEVESEKAIMDYDNENTYLLDKEKKIVIGLNLRSNQISDISSLQSLTNLTHLYLSRNQISDLSSLQSLTNLMHLYLSENQILDISSLQSLTNLTELNLSVNQISDISSLQSLTNLTELDLSVNQISDISSLQSLINLTELNLEGNKISDISSLQSLTNLMHLYLSENQISDISSLQSLTNLTHLYLSRNKISDFSSLQSLTKLELLYLQNNQISDLSSLQSLTNLTELLLSNNQISDISSLQSLTNLTKLYLHNNQISDISSLQSLTNLTSLNLGRNQISDISSLQSLTNLTWLNLSVNKISDLSSLQSLTNLTELVLSVNKISDISSLQSLTNLTELLLSNNQISDISSLQSLTNLTSLSLGGNQISDISSLQSLTNLTGLGLSRNQISDLSSLQSLTNLTGLVISNNQISDLSSLQSLTKLTQLDLLRNQISDISSLQSLTNLIGLLLGSNQISDISSLQSLTNLRDLYLEDNPFLDKLPAAIKNKDGLDILRYWIDTYTKKEKAMPVRELKVVFVGEGFSGKTSLMHLLLYGEKIKTTRTEKIVIHTDDTHFTYGENNEKLTLRFWDFGGQEMMHATHKFFMSEQTLYVLVSNGRKEENEALQNWIDMLKSSIGDSPVLLVANHLDNPADTHRIGGDTLRKDFKNLVLPVIETSYETGRGIDDLKNAIQTTLQKMPHFKEDFSPMYQAIRKELEQLNESYIDFKAYNKICQNQAQEKEETFERESQKLLANLLNDLGIMLNFGKDNDKLEDLLIFKPEWIVDGVYKIINSEEAQKQRGKIKESTINQLLKESNYQTQQERSFIVEMMEHFKLAYQQKNIQERYYLIPSLFDKDAPKSIATIWDEKKETLCFQFQYEIWRNDYILYFLVNEHQ
ncbi:MAG: hypothetical protein EAZ20_12320, partial [Bacteroidetes bacterium]